MKPAHEILFRDNGTAVGLSTDRIPLEALGRRTVRRLSTVEFHNAAQEWEVRFDAAPLTIQFSHPDRQTCLDWERDYFQTHIT